MPLTLVSTWALTPINHRYLGAAIEDPTGHAEGWPWGASSSTRRTRGPPLATVTPRCSGNRLLGSIFLEVLSAPARILPRRAKKSRLGRPGRCGCAGKVATGRDWFRGRGDRSCSTVIEKLQKVVGIPWVGLSFAHSLTEKQQLCDPRPSRDYFCYITYGLGSLLPPWRSDVGYKLVRGPEFEGTA